MGIDVAMPGYAHAHGYNNMYYMDVASLIINCFETNLAKNISPSPKRANGLNFVWGEYIFV